VDKEGLPHGYGERIFTSKDEFNGQVNLGRFVNGSFEGIGKFIVSNGLRQTGEFLGGLMDGVGFCEYANGDRYAGQFSVGRNHGVGTYTFSNGQEIIGWFAHDKQHGDVLFTYANGIKEALTYKHGKRVSETRGKIGVADLCTGVLALFRSSDGASTRERDERFVCVSPCSCYCSTM
jgi:hypothetical protein